jgi:hypothetical protein
MKNNIEAWDNFENEINATLIELEKERQKFYVEVLNDFKELRLDFYMGRNNESTICLAYETLLYFLLNEEYENCSIIRSLINKYSYSKNLKLNNYLDSFLKNK